MRNTGSMWLRTLRTRLTSAAEEALELNTRTHTHAHTRTHTRTHTCTHTHCSRPTGAEEALELLDPDATFDVAPGQLRLVPLRLGSQKRTTDLRVSTSTRDVRN